MEEGHLYTFCVWENVIGNCIRFSIHLIPEKIKNAICKSNATLIKQNRLYCNSIYPVCLSVCVCVCST